MKILIITPSYKPAFYYGGPIYSVAYLAENLSKENEVLVLSTLANGSKELPINDKVVQSIEGVSVIFFKRQTKDHTHFSLDLFSYLWKNGSNYDIVHIQSWWNLTAIFAAFIAFVKGLKYVVSPRGMLSPYTYKGSIYKRLIHFFIGNRLLNNAILHLTSTDEELKVKKLNPSYKTFVLPNYIDTNIPVIQRLSSAKFSILFLGRIHPKKGLDVLLRSLSNTEIQYTLNIIGEGENEYVESLKNQAQLIGIEKNINWLGSKLGKEKYMFYTNADVMILPSRDENFANTVLESLLCGTAVILSQQVGLADFIKQNDLGWIYDGEATELLLAIEKAYHEPEKRNKIRINAPAFISQSFNAVDLSKKYLTNYQKQWD